MGGSALGPGKLGELAELRRRAYGTPEGLADDPAALARLESLERAAHGHPTPPGASDPDDAGEPRQEATAPRNSPWRRRLAVVCVAAAAALAGALVTATILNASHQPTAAAPQPALTASEFIPRITLDPSATEAVLPPNPALTARILFGAATWAYSAGLDLDALQGYQGVGMLTPWTATTRDGTAHCVLLRMNDGALFSHLGCAPEGYPATVGVLVTEMSPVRLATDLPVGTVLLFTETESGVELRITRP